jgi:hypothetical protein
MAELARPRSFREEEDAMKTISWSVMVSILLGSFDLQAARRLIPGYYIGHSYTVSYGQSGEGFEMWIGEDGTHYAQCGDYDAVPVVENGSVLMTFHSQMSFVGVVSADGASVRGWLSIFGRDGSLEKQKGFHLRATKAPGRITITGMTVYGASSDGSAPTNLTYLSNTIGWFFDQDLAGNVYLFRTPGNRRVFYNGGNTTSTLNPNAWLRPGRHRIHFVTAGVLEGYIGVRLYFDNSPDNHITAFIPTDGSSSLAAAPVGSPLDGRPNSGSLSFSSGELTATLTDLRITRHFDLGWGWYLEPDHEPDTIGSFTLTVTRNLVR